jgi:hypothetical protein
MQTKRAEESNGVGEYIGKIQTLPKLVLVSWTQTNMAEESNAVGGYVGQTRTNPEINGDASIKSARLAV